MVRPVSHPLSRHTEKPKCPLLYRNKMRLPYLAKGLSCKNTLAHCGITCSPNSWYFCQDPLRVLRFLFKDWSFTNQHGSFLMVNHDVAMAKYSQVIVSEYVVICSEEDL